MSESREYWEYCYNNADIDGFDFSHSKPAPALVNFRKNYLKEGDKVLDLACGGGRNAHYLAENGFSVYGLDIAQGAVEFCRKRFERFNLSGNFRQGTFDNIPFSDNLFNAVVCIAALDHVTYSDGIVTMHEIRRVLMPGGLILITFDPPDTDEDRLEEAVVLSDGTLKFIKGDQKGMLFRRYTDGEIRTLLDESCIVSFDHAENGSRIIVCCQ